MVIAQSAAVSENESDSRVAVPTRNYDGFAPHVPHLLRKGEARKVRPNDNDRKVVQLIVTSDGNGKHSVIFKVKV